MLIVVGALLLFSNIPFTFETAETGPECFRSVVQRLVVHVCTVRTTVFADWNGFRQSDDMLSGEVVEHWCGDVRNVEL